MKTTYIQIPVHTSPGGFTLQFNEYGAANIKNPKGNPITLTEITPDEFSEVLSLMQYAKAYMSGQIDKTIADTIHNDESHN